MPNSDLPDAVGPTIAMIWRKLLICARPALSFDLISGWCVTALDHCANCQFALPRDDNANHYDEPDDGQQKKRADYLNAGEAHL